MLSAFINKTFDLSNALTQYWKKDIHVYFEVKYSTAWKRDQLDLYI